MEKAWLLIQLPKNVYEALQDDCREHEGRELSESIASALLAQYEDEITNPLAKN